MPHFFGEAKKRVGRRDEYPATPHGSVACGFYPSTFRREGAVASVTGVRRPATERRKCHIALPGWRVKQGNVLCRTGKPGLGPAADLLFVAMPSKVGKRRRPR